MLPTWLHRDLLVFFVAAITARLEMLQHSGREWAITEIYRPLFSSISNEQLGPRVTLSGVGNPIPWWVLVLYTLHSAAIANSSCAAEKMASAALRCMVLSGENLLQSAISPLCQSTSISRSEGPPSVSIYQGTGNDDFPRLNRKQHMRQ